MKNPSVSGSMLVSGRVNQTTNDFQTARSNENRGLEIQKIIDSFFSAENEQMTMEKQQFEDVSPILNGDFPLPSVRFFGERILW